MCAIKVRLGRLFDFVHKDMLRRAWLLASRTDEQCLRSTWNDIHHSTNQLLNMFLAGIYKQLATSLCVYLVLYNFSDIDTFPLGCTICARTRYRSEIIYCACCKYAYAQLRHRLNILYLVCSRVRPGSHQRRTGNDVANVDSLWNHAGLCS